MRVSQRLFRMSSQPFVLSAFARTILSHADESGLCVETLLKRSGICRSWLDDQRHRIPAHLVDQLLRECELAGVGQQFGYELVNGMATSCLQGLNILLDSAATLRGSLDCFVEYLPRLFTSVVVTLEDVGDQACLYIRAAEVQPHYFALDAAALSLVRNISRRTGRAPGQVFSGVCLAPGQASGKWLEALSIPFDQAEQLCLKLPTAALQLPLLSANALLHQSMLRHWRAGPLDNRTDRLELARTWLSSSDQPIERIAERLGYRHPNNFIRAFRKLFGVTPKQFRLGSF